MASKNKNSLTAHNFLCSVLLCTCTDIVTIGNRY